MYIYIFIITCMSTQSKPPNAAVIWYAGLCCRYVGLSCGYAGLFCRYAGLFCG